VHWAGDAVGAAGRVIMGVSPVGELVITNGEGGVRLYLRITGEVKEEIMVFGQEPCSADGASGGM